jgi:hypothetical protein
MLNNTNVPERVLSNESMHQASTKKMKNSSDDIAQSHQLAL